MRPELRQTLDELEEQINNEPGPGTQAGGIQRDERMLAVGRETATLLNTLVRARQAKRVLEVGGSMGYSTIWLGEAAEATGGTVVSLENVPSKVEILQKRVAQAGLGDVIEVRAGDARASLDELEGPFDVVLIDAWKEDYPAYFDMVFPKLAVGGVIVADNITAPAPVGPGIEEYVEKARAHPDAQSQLIPMAKGLEVTVKLR